MGFFDKMFSGLSKTRKNIEELGELFGNFDIDDEDFYEQLEEILVLADVGAETAAQIMYDYKRILFRQRIMKGRDARAAFIEYMHGMLGNMDKELKLGTKPSVILMVGVNGVGKTTLLRMILGELTPNEGRIKLGHNVAFGYYDQGQLLLNPENTLLEEMKDE